MRAGEPVVTDADRERVERWLHEVAEGIDILDSGGYDSLATLIAIVRAEAFEAAAAMARPKLEKYGGPCNHHDYRMGFYAGTRATRKALRALAPRPDTGEEPK